MAFGQFLAKHEYMYRADLNTFVPPGMPTVPKSNNRELIKKKVKQRELSQWSRYAVGTIVPQVFLGHNPEVVLE